MEHRYNHPCVIVFCELMIQRLDVQRAQRRIRAVMASGGDAPDDEAELLETVLLDGKRGGGAMTHRKPHGRRWSVMSSLDKPGTRWQRVVERALVWDRARRRRVLNRWCLVRILLANPSLRLHRWHAKAEDVIGQQPEVQPDLSMARDRARQDRFEGVVKSISV